MSSVRIGCGGVEAREEKLIKCALCGCEWHQTNMYCLHPRNDCVLREFFTSAPQANAINAAVEAARVDTRKPEECHHYSQWLGSKEVFSCELHLAPILMRPCPCAAWTKKEKS